jgi:glutathione S-transferase
MKLIFSPTSPYVRKVRITALEKGVMGRIALTPLSPFENLEAVAAANPLGKLPALILEDGLALYDSPVICEYLDSLSPSPRLIPESGPARWRVLRLQALADGLLDAAFNLVMEARRPEAQRSPEWTARWRQAVLRAARGAQGEATADWDLGQIALACALGYADFRLPQLSWRDEAPALAAWWRTASARPSVAATAPA